MYLHVGAEDGHIYDREGVLSAEFSDDSWPEGQHSHREKIPGKLDAILPFTSDSVIDSAETHFGMVHLQLQPKVWQTRPDCVAAVQKEYDQLVKIKAWDYSQVQEIATVRARAAKTGKTIYFGKVFPLCHIKHSELSKEFHVPKGRVVFGGDRVTDENGILAVFQEQGTSASHMICAKFLDALARLPGYSGEDSDACKAYTQAFLKDFEGDTETWIELPMDQWPKEWKGRYQKPVVRLLRNLYGHPLAGLYWEKHCDRAIRQCGFQPVHGWELSLIHI